MTVLLPPRLADALRDAAWSAGRLTAEGHVVMDHLMMVSPEKALGGVSSPALRAFKRISKLLRGRADKTAGAGLRSPAPATLKPPS